MYTFKSGGTNLLLTTSSEDVLSRMIYLAYLETFDQVICVQPSRCDMARVCGVFYGMCFSIDLPAHVSQASQSDPCCTSTLHVSNNLMIDGGRKNPLFTESLTDDHIILW